MFNKFKFIHNPGLIFISLGHLGFFKWISDDSYLKLAYKIKMGKKLNLDAPKTYNEKLQWLKINYRSSILTDLVDKYEVKKYVSRIIGNEYVIPTLGVWDKFDEINFDELPDKFVLKCTHDSGGVVICKNKHNFNFIKARDIINKSLKNNYYWGMREWPYLNVKPRIIAEKYLQDVDGVDDLTDYKFYCFNGIVDCVMVCVGRNTGKTKFYFFDRHWNLLPEYNIPEQCPPDNFVLDKPENMEEMFKIASDLSKGFPHIRVDLYSCNNHVYFGEMTFYSQSGFDNELSDYVDSYWGSLIDLV